MLLPSFQSDTTSTGVSNSHSLMKAGPVMVFHTLAAVALILTVFQIILLNGSKISLNCHAAALTSGAPDIAADTAMPCRPVVINTDTSSVVIPPIPITGG